jgi:peptidoglycan/xylan/chitin deacetylase (PgdA/CDA1 family)
VSAPGRAARALAAASLGPLFKRLGTWRGVLVLNYHRIGESEDSPFDRSLWSSTAEAFHEQVRFIARQADAILPAELEDALRAGRGRHVMLTFDDGYRDNHELAYPILRSHGVRACFFIATGFLDSPHPAWWDEIAWMVHRSERAEIEPGPWLAAPLAVDGGGRDQAVRALTERYKGLSGEDAERFLDFLAEATGSGRCEPAEAADEWMTWDMVREMSEAGMEIGGHTVTHPVLSRVAPERQRDEIAGCRARLEHEVGRPMHSFSYPNGTIDSFGPETRASLEVEGVRLAFSFYGGYARPGRFDRYDVPRGGVFADWSRRDFVAAIVLPQLFVWA